MCSHRGNIAYNLKAVALEQAIALDPAIAFGSRLFKDIQPSKLQLVGPALAQRTAVGLIEHYQTIRLPALLVLY